MNTRCSLRNIKIIISFFLMTGFINTAYSAEIKDIQSSFSFDKILITGTIKDESGNTLINARVFFDSTEVSVTDNDGKFSFQLDNISPVSHNIYFSCDGFVTTVRTYYPVMLSTSYLIILRKQFGNVRQIVNEAPHAVHKDSTPAIIIQPSLKVNKDSADLLKATPVPVIKKDSIVLVSKDSANTSNAIITDELDFPSIIFNKNATALTSLDKAFLDIISEKLKNNPVIKINIKAYTPAHELNSYIARNRLKNIVKYLVAKGAFSDRLNTGIIIGGGDVNTIDFFKSK